MSFNFPQVKKITIPVGSTTKDAKALATTEGTIWKGTWLYTINIGNYVSKVKYSTDNSTWTEITSNTTVEIDSGKTLYIEAVSYNTNDVYWDYTQYNFNTTVTESSDGGYITVYQTRARHYYTNTISAGDYVSTLKVRVGAEAWTAEAASVTITHLYEDTVQWELVGYNTDTFDNTTYYTYTGSTYGNFTNFNDNKVINRTLTTSTRYYTAMVGAGSYVSSVRIRVSGGSFGSAGSNASVTTTYGQTIIWEMVDYNGNTAQYTYSGDTSGRVTTYGDWSLTVSRTRTLNSYTITWKNHDGTVLKTDTVNYGATPSYSGSTPTKSADTTYTYSHSGWSPTVSSVTGDATYTATFSQTYINYTTYVKAGNYVSTVKAKVGSGSWSSASSTVTLTHHYNETIYWELVSYDTDYSDNTTHYYFSGSTSGNFASGTGSTQTINRSRTTGTRYYTTTVYAGSNVSTVKAGTDYNYSSGTGSSVSVTHTYNQTIYWALVSYNTDYSDNTTNYYYSGSTSGSFNGGTGTSYTASRSLSTSTRYYTTTVNAGSYVNTVRAKANSGSWTSAGSSVSVQHQYNETVHWEVVSASSYAADTTGDSFNGGTGTTYTVNKALRAPKQSDFTIYTSTDVTDDDEWFQVYVETSYPGSTSWRAQFYDSDGTIIANKTFTVNSSSNSSGGAGSVMVYYSGMGRSAYKVKISMYYNSMRIVDITRYY